MAYIRHHAKFEASRTTSQGRSGITLFSIGICKNRIVQNDKMAITFLFSLKIKKIRALYSIQLLKFHKIKRT